MDDANILFNIFIFISLVYKNIFESQKYAECYTATDAEREMNISRNSFVALAMLLGGDYTEGVKGVGIVNAMELLEAFDVKEDLMDGLQKFRVWLDGFDPVDGIKSTSDDIIESKEKTNIQRFHSKHRSARNRWIPPPNFPSDIVMKAYVDPVVDKSTERFTWGKPDIENLVLFCNRYIGWKSDDTRNLLNPIIEQMKSSGLKQMKLDSYMKYEDSIKFAAIRSKRLRDVLNKNDDIEFNQSGIRNKKKKKKKEDNPKEP